MPTIEVDKDMEDGKTSAAEIATASIDDVASEARKAFEDEHALTFSKAVSLYPAAVGWSLFFSLGIVMYRFHGWK
jgi:hypothetical protein